MMLPRVQWVALPCFAACLHGAAGTPESRHGCYSRSRQPSRYSAFEAITGKIHMKQTYQGGCACGAIRYSIDDEPLVMVDCQCRDCQHTSGTGHGSYVTFAERKAVKLQGKAT